MVVPCEGFRNGLGTTASQQQEYRDDAPRERKNRQVPRAAHARRGTWPQYPHNEGRESKCFLPASFFPPAVSASLCLPPHRW